METIMLFYLILYMILGLVIYHSIFDIWYFNFGKQLIGEIFGAFLFGAIMTGITLKFWGLALVIIILIGFIMAAKVNNPTGKKIVIGIFVVVAIITAITGIKYNRQEKEKEEEMIQEEQADEEEKALYYTPTDPEIYLKETNDLNSISAGTTYVCKDNNIYRFANIQYADETYGIVNVQFFYELNGQFYKIDGYYELWNNVDKPLIYKLGDNTANLEIQNESSFVFSYDDYEVDLNGSYSVATADDVSYYENSMNAYETESPEIMEIPEIAEYNQPAVNSFYCSYIDEDVRQLGIISTSDSSTMTVEFSHFEGINVVERFEIEFAGGEDVNTWSDIYGRFILKISNDCSYIEITDAEDIYTGKYEQNSEYVVDENEIIDDIYGIYTYDNGTSAVMTATVQSDVHDGDYISISGLSYGNRLVGWFEGKLVNKGSNIYRAKDKELGSVIIVTFTDGGMNVEVKKSGHPEDEYLPGNYTKAGAN